MKPADQRRLTDDHFARSISTNAAGRDEIDMGSTPHRVTVDQHAAFQEHCRDVLTEIQRIERESDLLSQLNREGIK